MGTKISTFWNRYFVGNVSRIVYGANVEDSKNKFYQAVMFIMKEVAEAVVPGRYLVDCLPLRTYIGLVDLRMRLIADIIYQWNISLFGFLVAGFNVRRKWLGIRYPNLGFPPIKRLKMELYGLFLSLLHLLLIIPHSSMGELRLPLYLTTYKTPWRSWLQRWKIHSWTLLRFLTLVWFQQFLSFSWFDEYLPSTAGIDTVGIVYLCSYSTSPNITMT